MTQSPRFARRVDRIQPSTIREILKLTQSSDVISFAGGLPAPNLFPVDGIAAATERVLERAGRQALQYSTTEGHAPLRAWIAAQTEGADADRVRIVSGSQQGLDVVAKALLDPGDAVAVAAPTYMGALRAFDPYEARYLGIATDEDGLRPDALEDVLAQRPKLLYVIPDFDNPTGTTLTLDRRHRLLERAAHHGVTVVEDRPYAELRFAGEPLPSLAELAPERVIQLGTVSKTLVPGFRLGWILAPEPYVDVFTRIKQAADLHTSTFVQHIATELLEGGAMAERLPTVRAYYGAQRERMLAALDAHMPTGVTWTRPSGGMFLWCRLPGGLDAAALLPKAVEQKVAYVPGKPFYAVDGDPSTLRLSYSVASEDQIAYGMERLGQVVAEAMEGVAAV